MHDNTFDSISVPAVTIGLVNDLANLDPTLQNEDGSPNLAACLFKLGFKVRQNEKGVWQGWETSKNRLVRVNGQPHKVYKTTVFTGTLRKTVKSVVDGMFLYTDKPHKLGRLYDRKGILSSENIAEMELIDIQDVGSRAAYNGS